VRLHCPAAGVMRCQAPPAKRPTAHGTGAASPGTSPCHCNVSGHGGNPSIRQDASSLSQNSVVGARERGRLGENLYFGLTSGRRPGCPAAVSPVCCAGRFRALAGSDQARDSLCSDRRGGPISAAVHGRRCPAIPSGRSAEEGGAERARRRHKRQLERLPQPPAQPVRGRHPTARRPE
jgi:hypothetical protein